MSNSSTQVIQIICQHAKRQGKPYTKRLLPSFLIPHCLIRLDTVLEARGLEEKGEALIAKACLLLGCIDERTVRRHLAAIDEAIRRVNLQLAGQIALRPELGRLPEHDPQGAHHQRLTTLLKEEKLRALRAGNTRPPPTLLERLQENWRKESTKKPSNHVISSARPP